MIQLKSIPLLVLAGALTLSGCRLPKRWALLPARRPLGAEFDVYAPSGSDTDSLFNEVPAANSRIDLSEPTGEITLRRALSLALAKSPELVDFAWGVREAEAEGLQASLLPNPELETEFENFAGSGPFRGARSLETTIVLSQLIELGGKRARRMELARAGGKIAGWRYEKKRLSVLTDVTLRFIAALATQKKLELAEEDLRLARAGLDAVEKELAAGKVTIVEKTKAAVEVATGKIRVARIRRSLKIAKNRLAAGWGGDNAKFTRLLGEMDEISPVPPADALGAHLRQNPELAGWAAEIEQRRAALGLARANAVPDVSAGVGYKHARDTAGNDHALVAELSIPLPVFDRSQGEILKARYSLKRAEAQRRAAEVKLRSEFDKAYQTLASARDEAESLRDEVLPAARSSHQAAGNSFEHGKSGYLIVLDAQRTLIKVRQQYLEALEAHRCAVTTLEGIIARPLKSPDSTPGAAKNKTGNNNVENK